MLDLTRVTLLNGEGSPQIEQEAPVVDTPSVETPEIESHAAEAPVIEAEKPVEQAPVVNDFPSERFEGKYKSWEEVSEALNKPAPEPQKFDETLQKVIDKYQADGDLSGFFKAYSVDYDKLSDEELVKRDFFAKNSDLSEKAANKLWEKELAKYKLDPEEHDEDDIEIANAMMKREASKLRESGKEAQKQYLLPSTQAAPKASVEDLVKTVHAMPEAQSIKANKTISFKVGDSVINYGVDNVDDALNLMADEEKFGSLFLQNGRPDIEKWVEAIEWVKNKDRIVKTVYDQGLAAGQKMIEKEINNPSLPTSRPEGRSNSGELKDRFFEAIAARTA